MLNELKSINWIQLYIYWELSLIKELGFEIDFLRLKNINNNKTNRLNIHRKVNELLKEEFINGMHALEIKILN